MFRRWCLPWIVWWLYRAWTWTWRIECHEPEKLKILMQNKERIIFAHWHGQELCIVPLVTTYKIATMTSTSADGQLIDFTIRRLGGATSKGSSTRGGIGALKGLIRLVRAGYRASMAVDGPKGPLHTVKPGVFELSRLACASVVPVGVASSSAIHFTKSWNKAMLPKPFARVVVVFGEPWVPLTADDKTPNSNRGERLALEISNTCQQAIDHLTSI